MGIPMTRPAAEILASTLRSRAQAIALRWEEEVRRDVPQLAILPRQTLIDHLPEFLDALATWVEGDVEASRDGFRLLAEGHALLRQTAGIELEALTDEYAALRRITLEEMRGAGASAELLEAHVRLNAGFDTAVHQAVHRYSRARDAIRERFVGILAHDLRDPLAAVSMSAAFLREAQLGGNHSQLVERIVRGTDRIERMINDVLDFTRGRLGGGIPIVPGVADMAQICREVVDEASAGHEMAITLDIAGDLRGVWDAERSKQALANLISNAVRHGKGEIAVRAWERDDRKMVFTSVNNAAPVISADALTRLFDPFKRTQKPGRGLGLGLYIVQQIALAHGGKCRVTSTPETGTTFTIEWPRVPFEQNPGRTE
jgi:signal transduction histidine kinase